VARSTYVYVVSNGGVSVAAYTVKHEMVSDIQSRIRKGSINPGLISIHRYRDSGEWQRGEDITAQFVWGPP
jgi:hypothetical protein